MKSILNNPFLYRLNIIYIVNHNYESYYSKSMGNIGTKSDDLCMYVQTNQPYYNPHGMVDGSVYIDVYRPVTAYRLDLRLKGVERVKWEELKQPGVPNPTNKITEKQKDKNEIFKLEVPLYQIGGTLNVGQYQFPFAFQLPDRIPGSFDIKHLDYEGRVKYTLTAVLVSDRSDHIKHSSELVVRQQPKIANYNAPINSEQAVCVCCISKGRSRLECCFQSDTYQPGQDAILMCKADNRACAAPIKTFAVSLLQRITFRARGGRETNFTRLITQSEYPGLAAGMENLANPQLMTLKLEDPQSKIMLPGKETSRSILQPNVHGQLIDCRYDLEVRPIFDVPCSCCSNVPVVTIPLYIYAPPQMSWIAAIPPGFRPTLFDVHQIIIPLPSMKIQASLPSVNLTMGMPHVSAHVDVGHQPNVTMNMGVPVVHAHVNGADMHISGSGPQMHISMPAPTMEVHTSNMGVTGGHMEVTGMHMGGEHIHVTSTNMGVTGAHMEISGPGMDISGPSLEVHGSSQYYGQPVVEARVDMPGIEGVRMDVRTDVSGNMRTDLSGNISGEMKIGF